MSRWNRGLVAFTVLVSMIGMISCESESDEQEPDVVWVTPLPTPWLTSIPTKAAEMFAQIVKHTPTPVRVITTPDIVRAANDYIGAGGVQVSPSDMVSYCESVRNMGWDQFVWYDLTDPTPT